MRTSPVELACRCAAARRRLRRARASPQCAGARSPAAGLLHSLNVTTGFRVDGGIRGQFVAPLSLGAVIRIAVKLKLEVLPVLREPHPLSFASRCNEGRNASSYIPWRTCSREYEVCMQTLERV